MNWNCPKCSKEVVDGWEYCAYCGTTLLEMCKECGRREWIGRPICFTRLHTIETAIEQHVLNIRRTEESWIQEEGKSSSLLRLSAWIHGRPWSLFSTMAMALVSPFIVGVFNLSLSVGRAVYVIVIIPFFLVTVLDTRYMMTLRKKWPSAKQKAVREYHRKHPKDHAMLRFIQSNCQNPGMLSLLRKILPP